MSKAMAVETFHDKATGIVRAGEVFEADAKVVRILCGCGLAVAVKETAKKPATQSREKVEGEKKASPRGPRK